MSKEILIITENELISGEVNQDGLEILGEVKEGRFDKDRLEIQINQRPPEEKVRDVLGENHEIDLNNLSFDKRSPIRGISKKDHQIKQDGIFKN